MKKARWHTCNVLETDLESRRLWHFAVGHKDVSLQKCHPVSGEERFPANLATKTWSHLWQPSLNIGWLRVSQLFLRVVHLPECPSEELHGMVELQLEKLSPLPVSQIVWSYEDISPPGAIDHTLVFVVCERSEVEAYLAAVEGNGFVADRLDSPWLHYLAALDPQGDGTWIHIVTEGSRTFCLVAWWYEGLLKDLNLIEVPESQDAAQVLLDHLTRIAWAGQIEGWLTSTPQWHLFVEDGLREKWEPRLREWTGGRLECHPPPSSQELAELTARKSARRESPVNLLPADYAARYRQQFVDRLWMGSLGAIVMVYLLFVMGNFGAARWMQWNLSQTLEEVVNLAPAYTNALAIKARFDIVQEQLSMRSAALDCLLAVSKYLPPELTLDQFNMRDGPKLEISGTVPAADRMQVTDFNRALKNARTEDGRQLFDLRQEEKTKEDARGSVVHWSFVADLEVGGQP